MYAHLRGTSSTGNNCTVSGNNAAKDGDQDMHEGGGHAAMVVAPDDHLFSTNLGGRTKR